ncbi:MAG: 3-hydroxyacyl-CoA dehydrogenase family protein [Planctomycetes bacterium]|nr:3-hydroxyacyl-CoA dehydrogenase family protein [Planctomycetota bacterium]
MKGKAAVIGTGIMGQGIAQTLSEKGFGVIMVGRSRESVDKALEAVSASRKMAVRRKLITPEEAATSDNHLTGTMQLASISECQIIIEAVVEDGEIKKAKLAEIESVVAGSALIATNTSALKISDLAQALAKPERFIGLHFMNPAPTSNLVEIIRGAATSDETFEGAKKFCKEMERQFVVSADHAGFIVNRLLMVMINEAARMMEDGTATPQDIDKAMRLGCGHPMGPVSLADFIGLDTIRHELKTISKESGALYAPVGLIEKLVKEGNLGRKSGKGLGAYKG